MDSILKAPPPKWFWVLCGLLFIWNLLGVMAFIQQMMITPEQLDAMPIAERELYTQQPIWVTIAFACAVFGGAIGTLILLLRKSFAKSLLITSLIGVIVQMTYNFLIANTTEVYGPGAAIMPAMVLLIAIFLVWFAGFADSKGWTT